MGYFIFAIGLAVLITFMIAIGLKKHAIRFREKLMFIFIGFLLVPAIPLAFITINLLTRNIDMGANKRIERALEDSFTISERLKETQVEIDSSTADKIQNITSVLQLIKQLQILKKPIQVVLWIAFFCGVLVLIVAGVLIAGILSREIERPIYNLVEGTSKIAQGNFGHQISGEGADEMGSLVKSFNKMSKELKIQSETLKDMERLKAWQELARRVSHEIRNPLTAIGISIDRLSQNIKEERDRESLYIIKDEIGNLKQLATEFSEFGRLPELNFSLCNLNEIVKNVVELYSNEQKIGVNYCKELPEVLIDKNSITRVLVNLIKNGIEAGGEVSISISMNKKWAIVKVSDTGRGIPKDLLPKVFEPYVTTKSKGTGLGLAIVKKIILSHKGQIEVDSEENKGTVVTVKLPL